MISLDSAMLSNILIVIKLKSQTLAFKTSILHLTFFRTVTEWKGLIDKNLVYDKINAICSSMKLCGSFDCIVSKEIICCKN